MGLDPSLAPPGYRRTLEDFHTIEAQLAAQMRLCDAGRARLAGARDRAHQLGVPDDANDLKALIDEHRRVHLARDEFAKWKTKEDALATAVNDATTQLASALSDRVGSRDLDDLDGAMNDYVDECRKRARMAALAAKRPELQQQLDARLQLEETLRYEARRRDDACTLVLNAASQCQLPDQEPPRLIDELKSWRKRREDQLERVDRAHKDYATLETLLDGRSPEELEVAVSG